MLPKNVKVNFLCANYIKFGFGIWHFDILDAIYFFVKL